MSVLLSQWIWNLHQKKFNEFLSTPYESWAKLSIEYVNPPFLTYGNLAQKRESIPPQVVSTPSMGNFPSHFQNNQLGGLFAQSNLNAQQNNPETMDTVDNQQVFQGWKRLHDTFIS
ncbi:hypothetical protein AVEN_40953-1 [Araneus ventricosus]|uniref:Uncharacterized protein n=1 Tax=Araneus ventricosus TaxID=182803 RepID=A0A4Y2F9A9_ARAVE|nr:hypothetical protein AVEN_40953-1 [Araneus ventricosus]